VCWCVWVGNWCVGACGLVTGVLVCVGWLTGVGVCGLVTGVLVCVGW